MNNKLGKINNKIQILFNFKNNNNLEEISTLST
jgi:hypothetical protein